MECKKNLGKYNKETFNMRYFILNLYLRASLRDAIRKSKLE